MKMIHRQIMLGKKKIEDMTDIEAAQSATLIDTDGSINPYRERDYYVPEVVVAMASLLPVKMAIIWGGTISKRKPKKGEMGEKRTYRWTLARRELMRPFLERIRPYSQVKGEQIEIALRMLDILDAKSEGWQQEVHRLAQRLSELKSRKPPDINLTTVERAKQKNGTERKKKS